MTTHLNLLASEPGEYPGFSANFSGDGFSDMRFLLKAVPAGDFEAWVAQVRGTGSALDEAGYRRPGKAGHGRPPTTYRSVSPSCSSASSTRRWRVPQRPLSVPPVPAGGTLRCWAS